MLITLAIIGVVASLTIPTLITKYQKEQTVVKLQKVYTIIMQAVALSVTDNGEIKTWDLGKQEDPINVRNTIVIENYLIPYFKLMKNCGYSAYPSACRTAETRYMNLTDKDSFTGYNVVLQDGTNLLLSLNGSPAYSIVARVDINGNSSPNVYGKDVFILIISKNTNKTTFYNWCGDRNCLLNSANFGCSPSGDVSAGSYCGELIFRDGWQIKDDYPWE